MRLGSNQIEQTLIEELQISVDDSRGQAFRVLLLGMALTQGVGFVLAQLLCSATPLQNVVPLGIFFGCFLASFSLGLGYFFLSASGETPEQALLRFQGLSPDGEERDSPLVSLTRDFYQSLLLCLYGSSTGKAMAVRPAAQLVGLLLKNGMTPRSQLEQQLTQQGFDRGAFEAALSLLGDGGVISSKANGVSLVAAKRRLFT